MSEELTEDVQPEVTEPEPEVQDEPQPEPSPIAGWFAETFGVDYESVSPDQREKMLAHALKAQPKPAEPSYETPDQGTVEPRHLAALASLSDEDIDSAFQEAVDGGDPAKAAGMMKSMAGAMRELPALFNQVISRLDTTVGDLKQDRELAVIQKHVPGATEADIALAKRLVAEGEVKSHRAALELAVFRRTSSAPKRTPDEAARRKASGLRASTVAQGGDPNGVPSMRLPASDAEWKKMLAKDLESGDLFAS